MDLSPATNSELVRTGKHAVWVARAGASNRLQEHDLCGLAEPQFVRIRKAIFRNTKTDTNSGANRTTLRIDLLILALRRKTIALHMSDSRPRLSLGVVVVCNLIMNRYRCLHS